MESLFYFWEYYSRKVSTITFFLEGKSETSFGYLYKLCDTLTELPVKIELTTKSNISENHFL